MGSTRGARYPHPSPLQRGAGGCPAAHRSGSASRCDAFLEARGIELFRIGSSLIPFGSHPVNTLRWWQTRARDFDRLGHIARRSRQRLSLHPSPAAASLTSVPQRVRDAAIAELRYGARVLELLGQGPEARVVMHLGGAAPSRPEALDGPADLMLEAKDKDLALFALRQEAAGREQPVTF